MGENPNHPPSVKCREEEDVTQMVINILAKQAGVILLCFHVPICHYIDRFYLVCLWMTQHFCAVAREQSAPRYCLELCPWLHGGLWEILCWERGWAARVGPTSVLASQLKGWVWAGMNSSQLSGLVMSWERLKKVLWTQCVNFGRNSKCETPF